MGAFGGSDDVNPFDAVAAALQPVIAALSKSAGGLDLVNAGALKLSAGFDAVAEAFAPVLEVLSQVGDLVGAFSPTTVKLFDDAMKNVEATVGKALVPILEVATEVLNSFSGILDPIADKFQPIIEKIAGLLAENLLPTLELLGSLLDIAADIIDDLVPVLEATVDVLKVMTAVMQTLVDLFKSLGVLEFFKGVVEQLVSVLKEIIKTFILLGATVAKFLGWDKAVSGFIANLEKQGKPEEKALNVGIQDAAFKGIDQISKDIQQAAFAATGGKPTKKKEPDEWAQDLLNQLKEIEKGQKGFGDVLDAQWNKISKGASHLVDVIIDGATEALKRAGNFVGDNAAAAGNWAGRQLNRINPF